MEPIGAKDITIGESRDGKHISYFPMVCLECGWGGWSPRVDRDKNFHPAFGVPQVYCPNCDGERVAKNEPFFNPKGRPWPLLDAVNEEREKRISAIYSR